MNQPPDRSPGAVGLDGGIVHGQRPGTCTADHGVHQRAREAAMRKTKRSTLLLNRDTLRKLDGATLHHAAGGLIVGQFSTENRFGCVFTKYTLCNDNSMCRC